MTISICLTEILTFESTENEKGVYNKTTFFGAEFKTRGHMEKADIPHTLSAVRETY